MTDAETVQSPEIKKPEAKKSLYERSVDWLRTEQEAKKIGWGVGLLTTAGLGALELAFGISTFPLLAGIGAGFLAYAFARKMRR